MRMHGSAVLLFAGLAACAASGSREPEASAPPADAHGPAHASLERALPSDRRMQHVYRGDLDGDGDSDALVLTSAPSSSPADPRGITALVHGSDGWRVVARNDRAVPCTACSGAMGDPLAGVEVVPGGFVLRLEGGSRELWSAAYRFHYEPVGTRWVLASVHRKLLDRATGAVREAHAGAADIAPLDFLDFDPADDALAPID